MSQLWVSVHRDLPQGLAEDEFFEVVEKIRRAGEREGMETLDVLYNLDEGKCVCYTAAPTVDAVRRAAGAAGLSLEEVFPVQTYAGRQG